MKRLPGWHVLLIFILLFLCLAGLAEAKTMTYQIVSSVDDTRCVSGSCAGYSLVTENPFPYGAPSVSQEYVRWPVKIPLNATISSAYLKIYSSRANQAGTSTIDIDYLAQDSAAPDWNVGVGGNPVLWTTSAVWAVNNQYSSPDIKDLLNAWIRRSGYKYGSYFGLRTSGSGVRYVNTYDGDPAQGAVLEINYTAGEAIIDLLMAEPHVRTKQYIYVHLWNHDAGDKIVVNLDGTEVDNYTILAGDVPVNAATRLEKPFLIDYTSLTAGSHTLTVTVKTSGNISRGSVTKTWTTLHNGYPKVGINENNSFCIRNQAGTGCDLFFPITAYIHNKEFFDGGSHIINSSLNGLTYVGWYLNHNILTWKSYLDSASKVRDSDTGRTWMVIGPGRGEWSGDTDYAKMINNNNNCSTPSSASDCSYVNYTKNHASLLGWMWGDEPNLHGVPSAIIKNQLDYSHTNDTNHPVFINLYGYDYSSLSPPNYSPQFNFLTNAGYFNGTKTLVTDVIVHDYYQYEFAGYSPGGMKVCNENYVLSIDHILGWNYNLVPFIPFIEPQDENDPSGIGRTSACGHALGSRPWTPDPTAAQIKNNIWISIIHGAKGIFYFGPDLFCPTLQYQADTTKVFKEQMKILAPVILQEKSAKATYQTMSYGEYLSIALEWASAPVTNNGRVDYTVREYGGQTFVIAARVATLSEGWPNGNIPTETAAFTLQGFTGNTNWNVYGENRTVTSSNGSWTDTFGPFDVHIYYTGSLLVENPGIAPATPRSLRILN